MQKSRTILLTLLFILFMAGAARGEAIPKTIGAMKLGQLQSGEEARTAISKLHGKQLEFREGYIASYKDGEKTATLWISVYDSDAAAKKELAKMTAKMAAGMKSGKENVFQHFKELSIKGVVVYFVTGMGQAHYFFKKGKRMFWLAVEPSEARTAIRDLLGSIS